MKKYSDLLNSQRKVTLFKCEWTIIHWYYEGKVPVCVIMHKPDHNPCKPVFETLVGPENEAWVMEEVRSIYSN